MSSNFRKTCFEKNMNCKHKLQSKGFYQKNSSGVPVLKFIQKLTLDFPFFPVLSYRQVYGIFKKVFLGLLAHVTPSNFFSRKLRSEALVYNSYSF